MLSRRTDGMACSVAFRNLLLGWIASFLFAGHSDATLMGLADGFHKSTGLSTRACTDKPVTVVQSMACGLPKPSSGSCQSSWLMAV